MQVPRAVQSESELRSTLDLLYAESQKGKSFTGILYYRQTPECGKGSQADRCTLKTG